MSNEQFSNKPLNILKASLPFLPGTAQRMISYYIKIEEFNILCNNLDDEIDNDLKACENYNSPNPNDLVNAIKPYLNNNERELIDMFLNMTMAFKMYTTYKSIPGLFNDKHTEDINKEKYADSYSNNNDTNAGNTVDFNTADTNKSFDDTNSDSNNFNNSNNNNSNSNNNNNSSANNSTGFNNINIDMLKNMLSPSQRAMFDTYSSLLNN